MSIGRKQSYILGTVHEVAPSLSVKTLNLRVRRRIPGALMNDMVANGECCRMTTSKITHASLLSAQSSPRKASTHSIKCIAFPIGAHVNEAVRNDWRSCSGKFSRLFQCHTSSPLVAARHRDASASGTDIDQSLMNESTTFNTPIDLMTPLQLSC